MSLRDQNIRFAFRVTSELPQIVDQLLEIEKLTKQQGIVAASSADIVKAALLQQRNDTRATAEENLAISKEIARQTTLDKKAQLDIQVSQVKASEAQQTAFVQASEKERAVLAEQIAKQSTNEQQAELKRREILLTASEAQKTAILKAEEEQRTAAVRAALLEQAQVAQAVQNQATLELKAELNKRTIAAKAESDEQVAAFRQDQIRQTAILRGELAEQRAELKQHGSAYQELRGFIASAFGVYEVVQFTKDVVDAKSTVDSFRLGLQQMVGTKKEADEVFVKLVEMAKTTPFGITDIQNTTFSLKAMGVATNELLPTIEMLGNMAAVAGTDKLPLIAKAYTDIMSKGKLMKQETNQMAENGVNLYSILATSMGKTREEVVKLAEAHEISFAQVKKSLQDATAQGGLYYGQMAILSQTLGGQVSNLSDKFFLAKARLGDYYKDGLQKVISGLSDLVDGLAGSDGAISRNVNLIKAAITAYLTYQGVANSVAIAEGAIAAAMVVKNGIMSTAQIVYGAYLLVVRAATFGLIEMTTAEMEATIATRAFGAAITSNPLGVIIALLGAAATAYYAYEAASASAIEQIGEQQIAVKAEQTELKALTEAAMSAAMGTKARKEAIDLLIQKYPQYFSGISSEMTNNDQLRGILDKVNASYMTRISLARQAYKLEGLQEELKKNLKEEAEILASFPKDLQAKYGGDITKAVADLYANPAIFERLEDFNMTNAKSISDNLKRIGAEQAKVTQELQKSNSVSRAAEVEAIKEHYSTLRVQAEGNSKKIAQINADEKIAISKANGTFHEKTEAALVAHTTKMKDITVVSQLTVKDILLNNDEMSYQDKVKYYKNLEALEIENINRVKVSTKASEADLAKIRKDALAEMQTAKEKYDSILRGLALIERKELKETLDVEIDAFQQRNNVQHEYTTVVTTGFKQIAKAARDRAKDEIAAEKDLQEEHEKTLKMQLDADKAADISRRKVIKNIAEFASEASPELGKIAKGVLSVIDNVDLLSGSASKSAKDVVDQAKEHVKQLKIIYDAGMGGTKKAIEEGEQGVAKAEKKLAEVNAETAMTVFSVIGAIYQVLSAVAKAINEMILETKKDIAEALTNVYEAYVEFADRIKDLNRETYKTEMETFTGSMKERLAKIDEYYAREAEYAKGTDRVKSTLEYYKKMAQLQVDAGTDAKKIVEGMIRMQAEADQQKYVNALAALELEKEHIKDVLAVNLAAIDEKSAAVKKGYEDQISAAKDAADIEKQLATDKRDKAIDAVNAVLDAQKEAYNLAMDAAKEAYSQQTDAIKAAYDQQLDALKEKESQERAEIQATYDLKHQLLEQATADQIEEVSILDRVRLEALERYRTDEIARITATRDRILATLTDEGERAQITAAYEQQLKDLHDTVEAAKLDKSKGVSLATTQLNKESKEEAERLKTEESATLTALTNAYQLLFTQMADERDAKLQALKEAEEKREADLKATLKAQEEKAAADLKTIKETYAAQVALIETTLKNLITGLQDAILANEQQTLLAKKVANEQFADAAKQLQIQVFENEKQLMIAQLKAEVAVLEAKKNIFNDGSITAAQNKIIDVINQLNGQSSGISPVGGLPEQVSGPNAGTPIYEAFTADGKKVTISYSQGHDITVYDSNKNEIRVKNGIGYIPETGQYFEKGTESVKGSGYPDGVDTVPAWLTKGERVLTVEQNRLLGDISNEELVQRIQFAQLLDMDGIGPKISLPDDIEGSDGASASIDFSELTGEIRKTREAIENQKLMNISIDRNGFALSEIGSGSIVNHYSSVLTPFGKPVLIGI